MKWREVWAAIGLSLASPGADATHHENAAHEECRSRLAQLLPIASPKFVPDGRLVESSDRFVFIWPAGSQVPIKWGAFPFSAACIGTYQPLVITMVTLNGTSAR